jgi:hypothetical protein
MKNQPLTFAEVSAAVRLDGGTLFWRASKGGVRVGDAITRMNVDGYLCLSINRRKLLAHRVVWMLTHGSWPDGLIDHIDRNKLNNDPKNLRVASASENHANSPPSVRKFKGITFHKRAGKYQAQCQGRHLGLFATQEEAAAAYDKQARVAYGEFAWLNFPEAA